MMYFAQFSNEAQEWLMKGKKIDQKTIRDMLGLGVEEKDTYEVLSKHYTHPLKSDSITPIIYDSDNQNGFDPYPYYNSNECRLSIGCWISFAKDTIRLLMNVFQPQQLGDRTGTASDASPENCQRLCFRNSSRFEEIDRHTN